MSSLRGVAVIGQSPSGTGYEETEGQAGSRRTRYCRQGDLVRASGASGVRYLRELSALRALPSRAGPRPSRSCSEAPAARTGQQPQGSGSVPASGSGCTHRLCARRRSSGPAISTKADISIAILQSTCRRKNCSKEAVDNSLRRWPDMAQGKSGYCLCGPRTIE